MISKTSKDIGSAIRRLRDRKKMTLKELSKRTAIPISSLSDIELGKRVITTDHLHIIATGLNIRMSSILRTVERDEILSRFKDLVFAEVDQGLRCAPLTHLMSPTMEPYYFIMGKGADTRGHYHEWEEEFVFVISGRMELHFGDESVILGPGDSAHFNAHIKHYGKNIADGETRYIVVHLQKGNN